MGDHHGTAGLSIANTTRQVSRRYTDPYGAPRGTAAPSWAGDHGFLDKPTDTTGLVAIGARYYDPALGRFASVDPVMDLADPQQWHGYAYANNNPITWSDPTGLLMGPGGLKAPVPGAITRAMGKKSSSSAVPPTGPAKSVPVGNTRDAGLFSDVDPDLLQWPAPRGLEDVPFEGGLGWGFVATGLATLWCIVPGVGWASCGLAQAGALGVRTWETASGDGSAGDKAEAIALDVVLTGTGFGIAAAWVRLGRSMAMVDDAALTAARLEAGAQAALAANASRFTASLEQGAAMVPGSWGAGVPNRSGVGMRWRDPAAPDSNMIRIDQGDPWAALPSQRVDHVVVQASGRILGPDGKPIVGSLAENPQAHIPLSDWVGWSSWNAP